MIAFAGEGIGDAPLSRAAPGSVRPVVSRRSDGFAECYEHSYTALTKQLYLYTGDLGLAQDLVQEAFCRALPRWSKVSTYDDPVAWIRRVAINRGLNKRRSRRRRDALTERIAATSTASALYGFDPADHDGDLADLIVTLPPQQRLALTLFYFADLPVAEVAHAMQLSEGTVKFHLHAARTALARALETTASESGDDA